MLDTERNGECESWNTRRADGSSVLLAHNQSPMVPSNNQTMHRIWRDPSQHEARTKGIFSVSHVLLRRQAGYLTPLLLTCEPTDLKPAACCFSTPITYRTQGTSESDMESLALYMGHSISMQRSTYDRRTQAQKVTPAIQLLQDLAGSMD